MLNFKLDNMTINYRKKIFSENFCKYFSKLLNKYIDFINFEL